MTPAAPAPGGGLFAFLLGQPHLGGKVFCQVVRQGGGLAPLPTTPARVSLHGLPELSRALGPCKTDLQLKLVLVVESFSADLDTTFGGPHDAHLAATFECLLLPLPCPLTVEGVRQAIGLVVPEIRTERTCLSVTALMVLVTKSTDCCTERWLKSKEVFLNSTCISLYIYVC